MSRPTHPNRAELDALLGERYGPVPTQELPRGGPDTPAAIAERRRVLCAALDGRHLAPVPPAPPDARTDADPGTQTA